MNQLTHTHTLLEQDFAHGGLGAQEVSSSVCVGVWSETNNYCSPLLECQNLKVTQVVGPFRHEKEGSLVSAGRFDWSINII